MSESSTSPNFQSLTLKTSQECKQARSAFKKDPELAKTVLSLAVCNDTIVLPKALSLVTRCTGLQTLLIMDHQFTSTVHQLPLEGFFRALPSVKSLALVQCSISSLPSVFDPAALLPNLQRLEFINCTFFASDTSIKSHIDQRALCVMIKNPSAGNLNREKGSSLYSPHTTLSLVIQSAEHVEMVLASPLEVQLASAALGAFDAIKRIKHLSIDSSLPDPIMKPLAQSFLHANSLQTLSLSGSILDYTGIHVHNWPALLLDSAPLSRSRALEQVSIALLVGGEYRGRGQCPGVRWVDIEVALLCAPKKPTLRVVLVLQYEEHQHAYHEYNELAQAIPKLMPVLAAFGKLVVERQSAPQRMSPAS